MLTQSEIKRQMELGNIVISPLRETSLSGPNSCDIHLGNKLLVYKLEEPKRKPKLMDLFLRLFGKNPTQREEEILDIRKKNPTKEIIIPEEGYVLQPGVLYLGETEEYTETYGFIPKIDGVSSAARLGLCIHITAGFGDIGYKGKWTLEITVVHPLRIYPGSRIGQIYYDTPVGEIKDTYHGKYQGSTGVSASKSFEDYKGE